MNYFRYATILKFMLHFIRIITCRIFATAKVFLQVYRSIYNAIFRLNNFVQYSIAFIKYESGCIRNRWSFAIHRCALKLIQYSAWPVASTDEWEAAKYDTTFKPVMTLHSANYLSYENRIGIPRITDGIIQHITILR